MGVTNNVRHVIGCHLNQNTRDRTAIGDVASNICIALHSIGCHSKEDTKVQNALDDMTGNISTSAGPYRMRMIRFGNRFVRFRFHTDPSCLTRTLLLPFAAPAPSAPPRKDL